MKEKDFSGTNLHRAESAHLDRLVDFIADDDWILEQKLDGHRVSFDTASGRMYNRNGKYMWMPSFHYNDIAILDGELVNGEIHFFDLVDPVFGYKARRRILEEFEKLFEDADMHVIPQAVTYEEKARLALHAMEEGYEGLIAKNLWARYGDRKSVLKFKFKKRVDCVVAEVGRKGKSAIALWLLKPNGEWHDVGACSTYGKEIHLDMGEVVEVEYLYVTDSLRLYQPVLMRRRYDKTPKECTIDQLVLSNPKAVWNER